MTSDSGTTEVLLRLPAVEARTGLKKTTIYARMHAGSFPVGVKLSARTTVWAASAIDGWISRQLREASKVCQ